MSKQPMATRENNTRLGVEDAWDFWLSQHEITVPDCIVEAITKAFSESLVENKEAVLAAIARGVHRPDED
jgi:hypothetical protein